MKPVSKSKKKYSLYNCIYKLKLYTVLYLKYIFGFDVFLQYMRVIEDSPHNRPYLLDVLKVKFKKTMKQALKQNSFWQKCNFYKQHMSVRQHNIALSKIQVSPSLARTFLIKVYKSFFFILQFLFFSPLKLMFICGYCATYGHTYPR